MPVHAALFAIMFLLGGLCTAYALEQKTPSPHEHPEALGTRPTVTA